MSEPPCVLRNPIYESSQDWSIHKFYFQLPQKTIFMLLHVSATYGSHYQGATLIQNLSCVFYVGMVKTWTLAFRTVNRCRGSQK
jgi:hypothetical protein